MSSADDAAPLARPEPPPQALAAIDETERASPTVHRRRLLWRVIANLVTLAILVGCFVPDPGLSPSSDLPWDKVAHVLAFAAFAFCWRLAGGSEIFVLATATLLMAATEIGQALFLPHRSAEWGDVGADAAGIALGLLLERLMRCSDPAGSAP